MFTPRIPLGDLRDAIRLDHELPPLHAPESPPTPRHSQAYDPLETPVLHGGRAAYLIPVLLVMVAWQIDEHVGIMLALLSYGVVVAVLLSRRGHE